MRLFRILFLPLFFFIFSQYLLPAQNVSDITGDSFEETAGRGLSVSTKPQGVSVFIDGVERGQTPVSFNNLIPGEYNIRLEKDGYKDRQFSITLSGASRLVVSIEMEEARGHALVSVDRAAGSPDSLLLDPQIFAGSAQESMQAAEDAILLSLPAGYRTIRVRAFGWEETSVTVLVREDSVTGVNFSMKPAAFTLGRTEQSRRRFNPKNTSNLGVNEYRFEVSAPGSGTLTITDKNGITVYREQLAAFDTWFQSVSWNGRDNRGDLLPEGIYKAAIEAWRGPETQIITMETEINYSINIYPLSLSGGISGLAFAPVPQVLPKGSFQIEGGILFGSFCGGEKLFSRLPFETGFRFSPLNKFEFTAGFNTNPYFDGSSPWGITGAVKFNILDGSGNIPMGLAASGAYTWAADSGEAPLTPGRGIVFYLPFSFELTDLSFVFSPGMRVPVQDGSIPRLLISAGALYRANRLNAGLSFRPEFDFSDPGRPPDERVRFHTGAEVRFYPPPSNLVFSFLAGMWTQGSQRGGFGGLGIGIIY